MQVENLEELEYLLQVYAQEMTFGDMKCIYCRLKLMSQRHHQQQIKDSHFKARNRDEDRRATGAPIKGKAKGQSNSEEGDCIRCITKGQCSFGEARTFKNDPNKKGTGKGRPHSPTGSPDRNSKGDGKGSDDGSVEGPPELSGTSPSGEANRPLSANFKKGSYQR